MTIKHDTLVLRLLLMVTAKISFSVKDIYREKTHSDENPVLKEQYEYGHLVCWFIKIISIRGSWTGTKFSKTHFDFTKIFCKIKVLETFKIFWLSHKHADLSNEWLFWKPLVLFFRRPYAFSVGFKIPRRKKHFPVLRLRPTQILP